MALGSENTNRNVDTELANLQSTARTARSKRDLTKHTHIFRLAIVLVELLLDVQVSQIQKKDGRFVIDVFVRSIQESAMSAEDLADRVQAKSRSQTLGDLIYFCLSTLQDSDLVQDEHVDEKFHAKAFLP